MLATLRFSTWMGVLPLPGFHGRLATLRRTSHDRCPLLCRALSARITRSFSNMTPAVNQASLYARAWNESGAEASGGGPTSAASSGANASSACVVESIKSLSMIHSD
jgi:hypothetical protein